MITGYITVLNKYGYRHHEIMTLAVMTTDGGGGGVDGLAPWLTNDNNSTVTGYRK